MNELIAKLVNDSPSGESPQAEDEAFSQKKEASDGETLEGSMYEASGEQGIRTLGTVAGTLDFESSAFDHSASSPLANLAREPDESNTKSAWTKKTRLAPVKVVPEKGPLLVETREGDEVFMRAALDEAMLAEAEGEVPVGCVIVHEGKIVARAHNLREATQDPTTHTKMLAIRDASRAIGSWRLSGCEVYVTLEPCPMCAGALVNSRVDRVISATEDPKAGATLTLFAIGSDSRLNHRFTQTVGVLKDEASGLLKRFFGRIRAAQKEAKRLQREAVDSVAKPDADLER